MQAAIQKLREPMISLVLQLREPVWKIRFVRLQRLAWSRMQNIIALSLPFRAMAFYKQIRNMVGTLLKIGNDRMPIEQIDLILEKKDRNLAGPTAAPNGLYLKEIRYE